MFHDPSHPSRRVLETLIDGQLDEAETARINEILGLCPGCQQLLDAIMRERAACRFGSGDVKYPGLPAGTVLGDRFVIRRLVAEGGQGAVYEASHTDRGGEVRQVAVKLLDLGRWDPEERYAYFRTEILAQANLTHPNIVPIYDFGEYQWQADEDDLPRRLAYYVMEFLPGGDLERQLRPPRQAEAEAAAAAAAAAATTEFENDRGATFSPSKMDRLNGSPFPPKHAAQTVETLARAMHYVHEKKIVHRDLKPRNVLVAADGTLKIVDFGLAWFVGKEMEYAQFGPTSGTQEYKAPEQVRGKSDQIDKRTDVYGLSAILHDLLTGQPPELARPRREGFGSGLRVLEGICKKGLNYEPGARYQSAEDLAEDLRRYRQGILTEAWPSGRFRRGWEGLKLWVRRNKAAAAAMVLLAMIVSLTAWGSWYFNRKAEESRELAKQRAAERDAKETERKRADDQRARAENLSNIARKAFSQSLERLGRTPVTAMEHEEVPTQLLNEALVFFQTYRKEVDQNPVRGLESARVRRWIGDVLQLLERNSEAEKAYRDAEASLARVPAEKATFEHRRELAQIHNNVGILRQAENKAVRAAKRFDKAVQLRRILVDQYSAKPEYRHELALGLLNLVVVENKKHADKIYEEATGLLKELAGKYPSNRAYRRELAEAHEDWADHFDTEREFARKVEKYKQALSEFNILVNENRSDRGVRDGQAGVCTSLGNLFYYAKQFEEAECYFRKALDLKKRLVKDFGLSYKYKSLLQEANNDLESVATAHTSLGDDYESAREWRKAEAAYRNAMRLYRELSKEPALDKDLIDAILNLGGLFESEGKLDKAEEWFRTAFETVKEGSADDKAQGPLLKVVRERFRQLALNYRDEADSLVRERRWGDAVPLYRKSMTLLEQMAEDFFLDNSLSRDLAGARDRLGQALFYIVGPKKKEEARAGYREAARYFVLAYDSLERLQRSAVADKASAEPVWRLGVLAGRLGICLERQDKLSQARQHYEKAIGHLSSAIRLDRTKADYVSNLFECVGLLTNVLIGLREHQPLAEAAKEWRQTLNVYVQIDPRAAIALASCIPLANKDPKVPEKDRKRLVDHYAAEATKALRRWIKVEYDDRKIKFDPNLLIQAEPLAPLRPFPEFKALIAERQKPFK